MTVKHYILDNLFEFVLLAACSAALAIEIGDAFNISYETLFNVALILCAQLPLLAVCFFGAYRRRNVPIAIAACLVLMALVVWVGSVTSVEGTFQRQSIGVTAVFNDVEGNNLIFGFILAIVPPVGFLLSRRRALCAIYCVLGLFVCGLIQWLFTEWLWAPFCTFLVAGVALFITCCYRASGVAAESDGAANANRIASTLASLVVSAVLVAASFGVWTVFVEPHNPPAAELKLVRMYYQPDIEWVSQYVEQDPSGIDNSKTSSQTGGNQSQTTSDDAGKGNGSQDDPNAEGTKAEDGSAGSGFGSRYSLQGLVEQYREISYNLHFDPTVPLIALLVALVAGAIGLKLYLRKRWHDKLSEHTNAYRVCAIYDRVSRGLARMKFKKPAPATQMEFAVSSASALSAFAQDTGGVDFMRLSEIYERVYYGHSEPTSEDVSAVEAFWEKFHHNARRFSGPVRYVYRFWRL